MSNQIIWMFELVFWEDNSMREQCHGIKIIHLYICKGKNSCRVFKWFWVWIIRYGESSSDISHDILIFYLVSSVSNLIQNHVNEIETGIGILVVCAPHIIHYTGDRKYIRFSWWNGRKNLNIFRALLTKSVGSAEDIAIRFFGLFLLWTKLFLCHIRRFLLCTPSSRPSKRKRKRGYTSDHTRSPDKFCRKFFP